MSDRAVESVDYGGDPKDDPACMLVQPGAEMEKAPSVASALVLFFPQAVLIFGLCTRKTCY